MADQASGAVRLNAFVDAAFAFAVTLLVIGGGDVPQNYRALEQAVRNAPAFAVGFALIAMFWYAHVRWRDYGTRAGVLPVLLSLAIVFLVLCYVYPLRLMAMGLVEFVSGDIRTIRTAREVGNLFTLYGLGFAAMSGAIVALFATSLGAPLTAEARQGVRGEIGIWSILGVSGLVSALLARIAPAAAPWVYALLPVAIPLFARRHWRDPPAGEGEEERLPSPEREGPGVGGR
jgi:uncharacterized membrane protein